MTGDDGVWDILVDGASRGNPGRAAAGARVIDPDGTILFEEGRCLGRATNNQAEYQALLIALGEARLLQARRVRVRSDSQLMIRQMRGEYKVKNAGLRPLYAEAVRLAGQFESCEFKWVPRGQVADVDRLANQALDREGAGRRGPTGGR